MPKFLVPPVLDGLYEDVKHAGNVGGVEDGARHGHRVAGVQEQVRVVQEHRVLLFRPELHRQGGVGEAGTVEGVAAAVVGECDVLPPPAGRRAVRVKLNSFVDSESFGCQARQCLVQVRLAGGQYVSCNRDQAQVSVGTTRIC